VEDIREKTQAYTARFMAGLKSIKKITPYGTLNPDLSAAVVSIVVRGYDAADVSQTLFDKYGIITRNGLHCSPLAHKTAGTFPGGTVRFSFGRGTTDAQIDTMLEALSGL